MKEIILLTLLVFITISCRKTNDIDRLGNYSVNRVWVYESKIIRTNRHESSIIKENLLNAKQISGPTKGFGILIEMTNEYDTLNLIAYPNSPYFIFEGKYYKSSSIVLPETISEKLMNW